MKLYKIELSVTLVAPFLFPGLSSSALYFDKAAMRDSAMRLVIPRDQVRGVLRHGFDELAEIGAVTRTQVRNLFGFGAGDALPITGADKGNVLDIEADGRGRIFFSDLVTEKDYPLDLPPHPRVAIDDADDSGSAKPGHLVLIEQIALPGTKVTFNGNVHAYIEEQQVEQLSTQLKLAFETHLSLGAMKTVGFGRIETARVGTAIAHTKQATQPSDDRVKWSFNVDRPYLVDAERVAENAYLGRPIIPGGALKGLVRRHLDLINYPLPEKFDSSFALMRFSHGRRLPNNKHRPASIVWDKRRERLVDLALDAIDVDNPVWQADWKAGSKASMEASTVWPETLDELTTEERVHTEINRHNGTVADHKLYSTIAYHPPSQGFVASVDFADASQSQRAPVLEAIQSILGGLGRTDAIVEPIDLGPNDTEEPTITSGRNTWILETPGLLADYEDGTSAHDAYRTFWRQKLPSSELVRHYAQQRLVGGYQAYRFGERDKYRPFLLTERGAVFVLNIGEDDLDAARDLLRNGICRDKIAGTALRWSNCPFVRENGYGELMVHTPYLGVDSQC